MCVITLTIRAIASTGLGKRGQGCSLERLVRALDLPPDLKQVRMAHLADWAEQIERYFESLVCSDYARRTGTCGRQPCSVRPCSRGFIKGPREGRYGRAV